MTAVNYLWDPVEHNIVRELDDTGAVIAQYTTEPSLYGDILSQRRNGQDSYYHYDGQGSTLGLTNANCDVTDTYAYSAFGNVTAETGSTVNPFLYIGQKGYYRDVETGDYSVRRRPYISFSGRWLNMDPIGFYITKTNDYQYSMNRPCSFVDPSGMKIQFDYSKDPAFQYWMVCGGFGIRLRFILDSEKLKGQSLVGLFQRICIGEGSVTDCWQDPCHVLPICKEGPTKKCKPCCFYEFLGFEFLDPDTGKALPGELLYDDNGFPAYSPPATVWSPFGWVDLCSSKGSNSVTRDLRVVVDPVIILEGMFWPSYEQVPLTCETGCRPKAQLIYGPGKLEKPGWWDDPKAIIDKGTEPTVTVDWNCCGNYEYQCLSLDKKSIACEGH